MTSLWDFFCIRIGTAVLTWVTTWQFVWFRETRFELCFLCFHFRCCFICRRWYSSSMQRTSSFWNTCHLDSWALWFQLQPGKWKCLSKPKCDDVLTKSKQNQDSIEQTWTVFGISKISSSDVFCLYDIVFFSSNARILRLIVGSLESSIMGTRSKA